MKIQNEQLRALQQQAEAKAKKPGAPGGFDALLAGELGASATEGQTASGQLMGATASLLGLNGAGPVQPAETAPEAEALAAVAQSIDSMISSLDAYAETLSSPEGPDLRKAYGILRNLDKGLTALRESSPDLATRHGGMAAMVDEISVIARAETVKMNRGDYLL